MSGYIPEGARPLLDELARRAKEALQPIIEDATRRATAQLMLKDAEAATALAARVQEAITAEFWGHPANMRRNLPATVDVSPVLSAMAVAAVNVFSEFLQSQPGTLTDTTLPDTKAPDKKAPDTKAPDTKAPDTKAPDTK